MKIAYKVWLDNNGKAFGDGPYELLKRVEKTKSLHQAANQMGMAYSKAWRLIQTLEDRLGFALLERRVGGESGGGSKVTPNARDLLKHYRQFRKDVKIALDKIYQKHFGLPLTPSLSPRSLNRTGTGRGRVIGGGRGKERK
jgi:molybdate transport system regulatory protein